MKVYQAISAVQAEMAKEGIAKDRNNPQQGYKFRGIDDVYNALAPSLSKHKLCVLPRCLSRDVTERINSKGTALFYVTVAMEFDFVHAEDGSKHTVGPMYGEAMDSGDKASNKAMSAAFKYACMQAFCIPTEGDNDSENQTYEVKPQQPPSRPATPQKGLITENQRKMIFAKMKSAGIEPEKLKEAFRVESSKDITANMMDDVLAWIDGEAQSAAA